MVELARAVVIERKRTIRGRQQVVAADARARFALGINCSVGRPCPCDRGTRVNATKAVLCAPPTLIVICVPGIDLIRRLAQYRPNFGWRESRIDAEHETCNSGSQRRRRRRSTETCRII